MQTEDLKPKTHKGIQSRNRLLRAAEYVFGEKGYHESSIVEITQHANMSLGSFYTYYESKYHIFEALLKDMIEELTRVLREKTANIQDRIEMERAGFKAMLEFVRDRPNWYNLFPQAEFVNKELYKEIYTKFADAYIRRIKQSMDSGEIRKLNPEVVVYSFIGIINSIGIKWVVWDKREIDDQLIDDLMDFIKYGIAIDRDEINNNQ